MSLIQSVICSITYFCDYDRGSEEERKDPYSDQGSATIVKSAKRTRFHRVDNHQVPALLL